LTLVTAGRVGRPHGYDGSFYVEDVRHPLGRGTTLVLGERRLVVERRAGTDARPLVRLTGLPDPRTARGELLLVEDELGEGEWLAGDLVGRAVRGRGSVARVIEAPSCSLLELDDGTLVPFVRDAIAAVGDDEIVLQEDFLG
jgi:16S rRNA processing protein RimM